MARRRQENGTTRVEHRRAQIDIDLSTDANLTDYTTPESSNVGQHTERHTSHRPSRQQNLRSHPKKTPATIPAVAMMPTITNNTQEFEYPTRNPYSHASTNRGSQTPEKCRLLPLTTQRNKDDRPGTGCRCLLLPSMGPIVPQTTQKGGA